MEQDQVQRSTTPPAVAGEGPAPSHRLDRTRGPAPSQGQKEPDLGPKRDEVRRLLTDMVGTIEVTKEDELTFPFGSTRIFIDLFALNEGSSVVNVYAIATIDVPPSEEFFRFLALNADAALFGHLGAVEREGVIDVVFSHRLLADSLDRDELERTVATVATAANEVDDVIVQRFGGRRYRDVVQQAAAAEAPSDPPEVPGYL